MHLTESRIGQLTREIYACTFPGLLTRTRLTHACRLLEHTHMTVAEVALDSGYEDPGYFHRVFKKAHSMTPLAFRRKAQKGSRKEA